MKNEEGRGSMKEEEGRTNNEERKMNNEKLQPLKSNKLRDGPYDRKTSL